MAEYHLQISQLLSPEELRQIERVGIDLAAWYRLKRRFINKWADENEPGQVWLDLYRGHDLIDGAIVITAAAANELMLDMQLTLAISRLQIPTDPAIVKKGAKPMLTTEDVFAARVYKHITKTAREHGRGNDLRYINTLLERYRDEVYKQAYKSGEYLLRRAQLIESVPYRPGSENDIAQKALIEEAADSPIVEVHHKSGHRAGCISYAGLILLPWARAADRCVACGNAVKEVEHLFCDHCRAHGPAEFFSVDLPDLDNKVVLDSV